MKIPRVRDRLFFNRLFTLILLLFIFCFFIPSEVYANSNSDQDCKILAKNRDGSPLEIHVTNYYGRDAIIPTIRIFQLNYGPPTLEVNESIIIELSIENLINRPISNINMCFFIENTSRGACIRNVTLFPGESFKNTTESFNISSSGIHQAFVYDFSYSVDNETTSFYSDPVNIEVSEVVSCISYRSINLDIDEKVKDVRIDLVGRGCFFTYPFNPGNTGKNSIVIIPYYAVFDINKNILPSSNPINAPKISILNKTYLGGKQLSDESSLLVSSNKASISIVAHANFPLIVLPYDVSHCVDSTNRVYLDEVEEISFLRGDIFEDNSNWYPLDSYTLNFSLGFLEETDYQTSISYKGKKFITKYDVYTTPIYDLGLPKNASYTRSPYWQDDNFFIYASPKSLYANSLLAYYVKIQSFSNPLISYTMISIIIFSILFFWHQLRNVKEIDKRVILEVFSGATIAYFFQAYVYSPPVYTNAFSLTFFDFLFMGSFGLMILSLFRKPLKEQFIFED
jgi:hypothetical protein